MIGPGGAPGNSQWVRTRTKKDARNFLAEQRFDERRRAERDGWLDDLARRLVVRVRSWFRRG